MRRPSTALALTFFLALLAARPSATQQTSATAVQRDQQGLDVLAKVLIAAGGERSIGSIKDFSGSGTITYYWAGETVQGPVTIKGRGTDQFRLDATLPSGIRTFVSSGGVGYIREPNGSITNLSSYQAGDFGNTLVFPFGQMLLALADASTNIVYKGLVSHEGSQVHQIRVEGLQNKITGSRMIAGQVHGQDFFVDADTFLIVSVLGKAYSRDGAMNSCPVEVLFSDYRSSGGVMVPYSIRNVVDGQLSVALQLDQFTFNNNLSDSDFQQ